MVSPATATELLTVRVRHRLRRFELDVSLGVGRETLALVGPSGAGKTSVLRAVAGLLRPDWARIAYAGQDLVDTERHVNLPPESRRVGMVFQDGALFPHLSLARNVGYGLWPHPRRRRDRQARVAELLARYGIEDLRSARPDRVSGGERQRAALDSVTKARVSRELARWLDDLSLPTILVSHDYADVAGLANRIAVIDAGRIVQVGTAADLTRAPASPFVAAFVATNYFRGTARRDGGITEVTLPTGRRLVCAAPASGDVALVVDPWAVQVELPAATPSGPNVMQGRIVQIARTGGTVRISLDCDPALVAELPADEADALGLDHGVAVAASWPPEAARLVADRR